MNCGGGVPEGCRHTSEYVNGVRRRSGAPETTVTAVPVLHSTSSPAPTAPVKTRVPKPVCRSETGVAVAAAD